MSGCSDTCDELRELVAELDATLDQAEAVLVADPLGFASVGEKFRSFLAADAAAGVCARRIRELGRG